jgi:hypothetical protein
MRSVRPSRDQIVALLGYGAILLAMVVSIVVLSLVLGDRVGIGRIVWFAFGAIVSVLWRLRSRLQILATADPPGMAGGWVGLIVVGVIALAVLPSSTATRDPAASTLGQPPAATQTSASGLRPAPPTAVRRTGTLTPVAATPKPGGTPKPAAGPSLSPSPGRSPVPGRSPSPAAASRPTQTPAATPEPQPPVTSSDLPTGFDPTRYLGQGNAYECSSFASQAEAQAVLRADPTDPNVIDRNRDGMACEDNPPPYDTVRVPRP